MKLGLRTSGFDYESKKQGLKTSPGFGTSKGIGYKPWLMVLFFDSECVIKICSEIIFDRCHKYSRLYYKEV